jgi:hypothetical protein
MADNKKQHYVPQFYLRNFSNDGKQIFVYHLASQTYTLSPIASTCQEKYFYDIDPEFEKMLNQLETRQAPVIKKIIELQNLETLSADELYDLMAFLVIQDTRTKDARILVDKQVELFVSQYIKPMMKADEELKKKYTPGYIDSLKITMPNFYKFTFGVALSSIEALSDLLPVLIVNKTSKPFISSDSPVVKNNYYIVGKNGLTGVLSPGLQIFCPLTDKIVILFIHREAYDIHFTQKMRIELTNENDVDKINELQILHCLNILLFTNDTDSGYRHRLFLNCSKRKTDKEYVAELVQRTKTSDGRISELVKEYTEGLNYYIHFSFIAKSHEYSRWFRMSCKETLKKLPIVIPTRNRELARYLDDNLKSLIENAQKNAKKSK